MKESTAMQEIRKIRDENSLRRLSQSPEEREQEAKKTLDWFIAEMAKRGKKVEVAQMVR